MIAGRRWKLAYSRFELSKLAACGSRALQAKQSECNAPSAVAKASAFASLTAGHQRLLPFYM
eukprot:6181585-Pleurochrysis_carterae.AAC.1